MAQKYRGWRDETSLPLMCLPLQPVCLYHVLKSFVCVASSAHYDDDDGGDGDDGAYRYSTLNNCIKEKERIADFSGSFSFDFNSLVVPVSSSIATKIIISISLHFKRNIIH